MDIVREHKHTRDDILTLCRDFADKYPNAEVLGNTCTAD